MATTSFTLTSYDTTNTTGLRTVGAQIAGLFSDAGLTKTSDTGQVDWTTITYTGTSATLGYEIYRFNDSLQATAPLFIRVNYASVASGVCFSLQLGMATDGAGTLSGNAFTTSLSINTSVYSGSGTGSFRFRANYNASLGFFGITLWDDPATSSSGQDMRQTFMLARACDATGAPTGSGVFCYTGASAGTGGAPVLQVWSSDTTSNYTYQYPAPGWGVLNSLAVGTDVQFVRCTAPFPAMRTLPQMLYYASADVTRGTTVSLSPYGTSHTYITTGATAGGSNASLAMLWE